jgi:hypothetical protein
MAVRHGVRRILDMKVRNSEGRSCPATADG